MTTSRRIYLDNAATSWPKPDAVYAAVDHYQREVGAGVGRSAYRQAIEVGDSVEATRRAIATLIGAKEARRVIFALNATDALNLAIHGMLRSGDHVVTTVAEHNSVLRPLRFLKQHSGIKVSHVPCDSHGIVDPGDVRAALRPNTRLVAVTHASNVTGALQRIDEIAALAHDAGARVLVDAAQSLGHVPIDVSHLSVDLLAAAGHKGLLGPLGTGFLYIAPHVEEELIGQRQGGTGSKSDEDRQPDELPDRYECGNLNAPGIIGWGAGIAYLMKEGIDTVRSREHALTGRLIDGLSAVEGVRLYGPGKGDRRVGVVSLTIRGYDPQEVAATLDAAYCIQVRPGLHCAPLMHRAMGTIAEGGTVRLSLGAFNTDADVLDTLRAVAEIAAASLTVH